MKVLISPNSSSLFSNGSIVTIGNFDGVHLGHQALLATLRKRAEVSKLPLVVVLFEPQPAEFFATVQPRLQSLREKIAFLADCGVDYIYKLKFDEHLAQMTAGDFVKNHLINALNIKHITLGQDFRFGWQRQGDIPLLQKLAKTYSYTVDVFTDHLVDAQRVSSTQIRNFLLQGNLAQAKRLLGRDYSLCGRVIKGRGLGQQWGIPTANISIKRSFLPLKGVFCVKGQVQGCLLEGVANLGLRPTVGGDTIVLEIHFFNCTATLYGELLHVFFLHKLRDELKFPSVDELICQIRQDIVNAHQWFTANPKSVAFIEKTV